MWPGRLLCLLPAMQRAALRRVFAADPWKGSIQTTLGIEAELCTTTKPALTVQWAWAYVWILQGRWARRRFRTPASFCEICVPKVHPILPRLYFVPENQSRELTWHETAECWVAKGKTSVNLEVWKINQRSETTHRLSGQTKRRDSFANKLLVRIFSKPADGQAGRTPQPARTSVQRGNH